MPTSTFQEQGTVTPVASVHVDYVAMSLSLVLRRTSLPAAESPRPRVCVGRLTTSQCVTSSSPLFRASSARAPLDRVPQWCEERHCAGVFSYWYFVRFLELKCEAWNSKTRYLQAQPATPRARWHPRSRAEHVLCKKASCPQGTWQILPLASP